MTTGMTHFIMRSGRRTAMAEIPTPDLAVPYLHMSDKVLDEHGVRAYAAPIQVKTMAEVQPIAPKNGA